MRRTSSFIAVVMLSTARSRGDQGISARLTARVDSGAAAVDLTELGPPSWDKLCVLGPYTLNEQAEQLLGFKWDANGKSSIGTSDGINLLVFVKGQDVVAYAEHPRSKGDFLKLNPRCLSRSKARLLRQSEPGGRVQLIVAQA